MDEKSLKKWIRQQKLDITKDFYRLVRSGNLKDCASTRIMEGQILMLDRLELALKDGEV